MLNEIYVVNEIGQLEINFEALELVTDQFFVHCVKNDILKFNYRVFKFIETSTTVRISLVNEIGMVMVRTFIKNTGHIDWESFTRSEIEEMYLISSGVKTND